jgi:hypothetical protein
MPHRYWVDADVYIQAKNGPYGFDFAKPFWKWIEQCNTDSIIHSPMTVYDELAAGDDELSEWAKDMRDNGLFVEADKSVQSVFKPVADFVTAKYKPSKYVKFLAGADPWIVAHAKESKGTVVTHEKRISPNCLWPKIPNLCDQFSVKCLNIYDLIRLLGTLKFK